MPNKINLNLRIDRNSKIPYYYQLYSSMAQKIDDNTLRDGDKLPNEMDLCKEFGISRITVRQAFKELEVNGYVFRERGRGTFVRKKIETHSLERFSSIIDELKKEGVKIKGEILDSAVMIPDEKIRQILKLESKEQIFFIRRLIYADGSPFYTTKAYIPYSLTGKISKKTLTDNSLMETITKVYNLRIMHSKSILEPVIPDEATTELLSLDGKIINAIHYMQTVWTIINKTETKLMYIEDYFNPSKGKFVFEKNYT